MAATKWTAKTNRDRLIGSAKAISDGLIASNPGLAPFEEALTKALFNYGVIVGNHVANYQDAPEPLTAAEATSKPATEAATEALLGSALETPSTQPEAARFAFTLAGPVEWGIVG